MILFTLRRVLDCVFIFSKVEMSREHRLNHEVGETPAPLFHLAFLRPVSSSRFKSNL